MNKSFVVFFLTAERLPVTVRTFFRIFAQILNLPPEASTLVLAMAKFSQIDTVPARHWESLPNGRVQCQVCPCSCMLKDGQRGACFVRANFDGKMVLTTYGRSSGFCVDPIEKKPLNHFLPGTPVLSFGTAGCNLTCRFCQNWDISKSREIDTLSDQAKPDVIAKKAQQLGCRSVAFTYNDPIIFLEYAVDIAKVCKAEGIYSVAVTAGYVCDEARHEFFSHMDAANVDLKGFTEEFYEKICGANLSNVLETLIYLKRETKVWFELTTLLIPDANDSPEELDAMTKWVVRELGPGVPMHFTAFHPDYKMLDVPRTPLSTLSMAREIAIENGVRYAYTGNVHDEGGGSTFCHACDRKVVGRDWYELTAWHLTEDGCCEFCGTPCAGFFSGPAGTWGRRRKSVRLAEFA